MKKISLLTMLLVMTACMTKAQVQFISGSWEDAKAKAKKENKYILVDAYTDWCHWCKVMDRETFPTKQVGDLVNSKFIPVKIDMEKGTGVDLSMKYRVSSYPTFLVFNSNGNLVDRIQGFQDETAFVTSLEEALDESMAKGVPGVTSNMDLAYPDFYVTSFKGNKTGAVKKPSADDVLNFLDKQPDLFSEVSWSVMTRFISLVPKYQQYILDNKEKYEQLYGKSEVMAQTSRIMDSRVMEAIKKNDEKAFNETLSQVDKYMDDPDGDIRSAYLIKYYQETNQWIKMDKLVQESINRNGITPELNEYAWSIYVGCDDPAVIQDAISWMRVVTERQPDYAALDTYAALLYKDKQYVQAERVANLAIAEGKKNKENVKETEDLLVKIKAAK